MLTLSNLFEARGRQTGREYTGGTDVCKCPKCGTTVSHVRNIPCNKTECPKCGTLMTGVGTIGSKIKKGK